MQLRRVWLREFGVAFGFSLATATGAFAQKQPSLPAPVPAQIPAPPPAPPPYEPKPANVVTRYTLPEALASGQAKHPQLAALQASMNAALMKQRGLDEAKRLIGITQPDMKYRERQADLGLQAAFAEYEQAQYEVTYAVVRCYYTVVYAREQTRVARDLVDQLEINLTQVKQIVESKKGGVRDITQNTVDNLQVLIGQARKKLNEAEIGTDRARAALREAMGLEPGARVDAADEMLPDVKAEINRDTVIAHAVSRRGEVKLAQIGADVTKLEACAQWSRKLALMASTYAYAADIHARPIPTAHHDPDYKPGAIGPEMPERLIGLHGTRRDTAKFYADRAKSAADEARSLVGLEAEVGYTRWLEAVANVRDSRKAAAAGKALTERLREAAGGIQTKEQVLLAEAAATQARASLNEALYDQITALANLERITAGGVHVNFQGR